MRVLLVCIIIGSYWVPFLQAETVDRIVAIVGDKVITQSELDELKFFLPGVNNEDLLNQLIERELLLVEANKETVEVESEEIESAVEEAILGVRGRFPSDEEYEIELERTGMSEENLRAKYRVEIKKKLLIQKLFQTKVGKQLSVSDIEVIEFYNTRLESIPPLPDAIKLLGVVVQYSISEEAKSYAKIRVDDLLARIKKGKEPFEMLAKKYSADPISREKGGNLGTLSIADLGGEFQLVVKDMIVGEVATVPTFDAYHIIRCNERYEERINLSDIVIKIAPTRSDSQAAREIVDSVIQSLEREEQKEFPGAITISWGEEFIPLSATTFSTLEAIELGKVYTFNTPNGIQVVKPIEKRPQRMPTWQEIREELKGIVYQRKLQYHYERLINKLKEEVFVKQLL